MSSRGHFLAETSKQQQHAADKQPARERFAARRVGRILCGSNVGTDDFARWVLATADAQPRDRRRASSNDPLEIAAAPGGATDRDRVNV